VCHHNTFYLYESLKDGEIKSWRKVTHTSVGIALLLMAALGFAGYSTFTSTVQGISLILNFEINFYSCLKFIGDLLNNYCWTDDLMNVSRIFFTLTTLLTYPLECFASREVLKTVIWRNGEFQKLQPKKVFQTVFPLKHGWISF